MEILACPLFCYCCSVTQSCPTLCNPMDCSTPGFSAYHHLPELAQTHVHWVSDAIQPSHPLLSPSPPASNLSQHQSFLMNQLFASDGQSIRTSALASGVGFIPVILGYKKKILSIFLKLRYNWHILLYYFLVYNIKRHIYHQAVSITHITTNSYIFFIMTRTFKAYPLSNF